MKFRLFLAAVVVLAGVNVSNAQTFRGSVEGTVTDSTGAAIAGATVTIANPATGLTRTVQSSAQGDYFFPELPLGDYNLTVSQSGFRTVTQTGIHVTVATPIHLDVALQPGQVQQTVEVTAEVPLVEVTGNTLGGTIGEKQISELPINGRDFIKLMVLVPGSTADPSGVSDSPGAFGQFSINGNRGRSNNFLLDGTDMNDGYRNDSAINEAGVFGTPATLVPIEAVAEVAVLSSTEPEYGRNSGATINIVTKSGTNNWHGSLFWQLRNDWLDARNFFNPKPSPQDEFRNNQFGGSVGGPIFKDKTFFYLAYEGQREIIGIPENLVVPSQAQITNDLAELALAAVPESPVVANLLALNPWGVALPATGNIAGPNGPAGLQVSNKSTNFLHSLIFKLDQHIGQSDVFTGRYFYGTSQQSFPLALVGGGITPGFNTNTPTDVHVISLSYTHVFSPRLLMEVRGGWNSFDEDFFPQDHHFDPASIGLNTGVGPLDFGLSLIPIGGAFCNTAISNPAACALSPVSQSYATLGSTTSVPRGRVDRNWQLLDNFSWTKGRHNIKFGAEFRRTTVSQFFDSGYRGKISFDGSTFGDALMDFLAGATDGGRAAQGNSQRNTHENSVAFYAQDTFHLSRNLTLTYGLRWEYFGVIGQFSIFDPTIPGPRLVNQLYPKDFNNFSPRVAFAWDVRGNAKTVVRAGWGLFYDAFSQDFFIGQLPFNTFNPGPAYNGVGPNPITFNFSAQPAVGVPGPCVAPNIPIPNSGGQCAPPVFNQVDFSAADVFTVDQRLTTPYVQNFNLNVEQQIGEHAALSIGYIGSQGRHLFRYVDINQCLEVGVGNGGTCFPSSPVDPITLLPTNELASPFGAAGFEYINQFQSSSSSSYNSLQVSLRIRNWHGLNSVANYTWGHAIDNASDGQDFVAQATQPDNSFAPQNERANSNYDTRNRFNWNFLYEFPKSQNLKWLLSGWAVNGVLTLMDGQPYNLTYQFEDDFNGSGEFFGRPDLVAGTNPFTGASNFNLINLGAFAVPCLFDTTTGTCVPGTQHFGNVGRNAFRGPSFRNFDFSLVKNTALGERVTMQIRADFFNLTNHPNFTNPTLPAFAVDFLGNGTSFTPTVSPTQGILSGTGFLQPTATPDVGIGNPFLGGGGPRNIQLGIRFSF
jgi:hypothetical protein